MIDKPLNNLCATQGVGERKIATCLSPPGVDEFCNLVEQPVELNKLFNQRRKLPSNIIGKGGRFISGFQHLERTHKKISHFLQKTV